MIYVNKAGQVMGAAPGCRVNVTSRRVKFGTAWVVTESLDDDFGIWENGNRFARLQSGNKQSFVHQPVMAEHPRLKVTVGREDGDGTVSRIELCFGGGYWEVDGVNSTGVILECHGNWERDGLIGALEHALRELKEGYQE